MRCRNSYTSVLGDAQRYIWGANLISSLRKTSPRGLALRLGSLRSRHFSVLKSAACIMHPPVCLRKCLAATGTRRAVNKLPQLRFESFKEGLLWLVMTWLLEQARERGWIWEENAATSESEFIFVLRHGSWEIVGVYAFPLWLRNLIGARHFWRAS